jgi:hypothetical protein
MPERYIVETQTGFEPGIRVDSAVVVDEKSRWIIFDIDGIRTPMSKEHFPVYTFASFDTTIKITFKHL